MCECYSVIICILIIWGRDNAEGADNGAGKRYELKGKETQDGICHAKVPKDVIISGNCDKDVTINYKTINGLSHTLTGDVKCLGNTSQ